MHAADLFSLFTGPLDDAGIAYVVTGSVAGISYGEPRMTHDIDMVLSLAAPDAQRLVAAFPAADFYCPPIEVIRVEIRRPRRGHFNLIHHETGFKADIYLRSATQAHTWAFANRRHATLGDNALWLAPPEYVVLSKLAYYREGRSEKHLRDIAGILATQGDDFDYAALDALLPEDSLSDTWAQVKQRVAT